MDEHDAVRNVAQQVGKAVGMPELARAIGDGRLSADESLPLLAGMLDGTLKHVFMPVVNANRFTGFGAPSARPLVGEITLADGSVIRITLEAL